MTNTMANTTFHRLGGNHFVTMTGSQKLLDHNPLICLIE